MLTVPKFEKEPSLKRKICPVGTNLILKLDSALYSRAWEYPMTDFGHICIIMRL